MKIIFLGGQNIVNKSWIESVRDKFVEKYPEGEVLYYDHWKKEETNADVEAESRKLLELLDNPTEEYYIFAKSIGTVILANSLPKLPQNIRGAFLVGVPLLMATKAGYDFKSLQNATFPVHIYQKELDPYCSYNDLLDIKGGSVSIKKYDNPTEPNSDHHYADTNYLLKFFDKLITLV